jgi:hypothetical protein
MITIPVNVCGDTWANPVPDLKIAEYNREHLKSLI